MKEVALVNIGSGNYVDGSKVLSILKPGSSPVRRLIKEARDDKRLLDATNGKKTGSVMVMDNGFIVLSPFHPETLVNKFANKPGILER